MYKINKNLRNRLLDRLIKRGYRVGCLNSCVMFVVMCFEADLVQMDSPPGNMHR